MLSRFEQARKQLGGNNHAMDQWLEQRQELIKEYCALANFSLEHTDTHFSSDEVKTFFEVLIDYLSAGHFKIYNMVMADWDKIGYIPTKELDLTYLSLKETTNLLLPFNDRYADTKEPIDGRVFAFDVAELGKQLDDRFEIEDHLIRMILQTFKDHHMNQFSA